MSTPEPEFGRAEQLMSDLDTKDAEIERLTTALDQLRDAHHTPYADDEHQGGNCVDMIMAQTAETARLRAEVADLRDKANKAARALHSLPGVYTIGPGNEMRVIELLWDDARKIADELTGAPTEPVPALEVPADAPTETTAYGRSSARWGKGDLYYRELPGGKLEMAEEDGPCWYAYRGCNTMAEREANMALIPLVRIAEADLPAVLRTAVTADEMIWGDV